MREAVVPQAYKPMTWFRVPGVVTRWTWVSNTEPQYKYTQSPNGYWVAWHYGWGGRGLVFTTREEARQWCEVHYACGA